MHTLIPPNKPLITLAEPEQGALCDFRPGGDGRTDHPRPCSKFADWTVCRGATEDPTARRWNACDPHIGHAARIAADAEPAHEPAAEPAEILAGMPEWARTAVGRAFTSMRAHVIPTTVGPVVGFRSASLVAWLQELLDQADADGQVQALTGIAADIKMAFAVRGVDFSRPEGEDG